MKYLLLICFLTSTTVFAANDHAAMNGTPVFSFSQTISDAQGRWTRSGEMKALNDCNNTLNEKYLLLRQAGVIIVHRVECHTNESREKTIVSGEFNFLK